MNTTYELRMHKPSGKDVLVRFASYEFCLQQMGEHIHGRPVSYGSIHVNGHNCLSAQVGATVYAILPSGSTFADPYSH